MIVSDAETTAARDVSGFIAVEEIGQAVAETIDPFLH